MKSVINCILSLAVVCLIVACGNDKANPSRESYKKDMQKIQNESSIQFDTSKFYSGILHSGWYFVSETNTGLKKLTEKRGEIIFLDTPAIVSYQHFLPLEEYKEDYEGKQYLGIAVKLDKEGSQLFSEATGSSNGKRMALVLDNKVVIAALIQGHITTGVMQITLEDFSESEIKSLIDALKTEKQASQKSAQ